VVEAKLDDDGLLLARGRVGAAGARLCLREQAGLLGRLVFRAVLEQQLEDGLGQVAVGGLGEPVEGGGDLLKGREGRRDGGRG